MELSGRALVADVRLRLFDLKHWGKKKKTLGVWTSSRIEPMLSPSEAWGRIPTIHKITLPSC